MPFSKQLLILGNGFDLHCGLKSSYDDFFCSTILYNKKNHHESQQIEIENVGFWEGLLLEYYNLNGNTYYNWCDIEKIIEETLLLIYYGESNTLSNLEFGLGYTALNYTESGKNLYTKVIQHDSPIIRYLFTYCSNYFSNILIKLFGFRNKSILDKLNLLSINLLRNLNYLEYRFCQYLKNRIINPDNSSEINVNYVIKAADLLTEITGRSLKKFWDYQCIQNLNPNSEISWGKSFNLSKYLDLSDTYILNFNYTALFDLLNIQSPCAYNNVHGKLCNKHCTQDCEGANIIFGIDDRVIQAHDVNSELRLFSKTYRKMSDTSSPANILPANDGTPIVIKFYGHSLSEADYSYFQSIFDYYNLYGNSNIRLMFYYSKGFEQNDKIYKLINSYGQTLSNQDQGKNLMHKLLLENRLKIVEIP